MTIISATLGHARADGCLHLRGEGGSTGSLLPFARYVAGRVKQSDVRLSRGSGW